MFMSEKEINIFWQLHDLYGYDPDISEVKSMARGTEVLDTVNGVPIVRVYQYKDEPYRVIFWCNWCKKFHGHGRGKIGRKNIGERVAHCTKESSPFYKQSYYLQEVDE